MSIDIEGLPLPIEQIYFIEGTWIEASVREVKFWAVEHPALYWSLNLLGSNVIYEVIVSPRVVVENADED